MADRAGWRNYFFIRRRPKFRVSRDWDEPKDDLDPDYQKEITDNGFITQQDLEAYIEKSNATPQSSLTLADFPTVSKDLEFFYKLEVGLMPKFFKNDRASMYYQNAYYLFSWVFAIGAVTTTLLSVATLVFATNQDARAVLALLTVIVGILTTVYSNLNRTRNPLRKWYVARRQCEAIRNHFFLYVLHARPYRGSELDRNKLLMAAASKINVIGKTPTSTAEMPSASGGELTYKHNQREVNFLRDIYKKKRYLHQLKWYENRRDEFETNLNFTAAAAIAILAVASISPLITGPDSLVNRILSPLNAPVITQAFLILLAVLPAIGAAFIAFQQVYNWERQYTLYEETMARLEDQRPKIILDDLSIDDEIEVSDAVYDIEAVLAGESDQWGQDVMNLPQPSSESVLLDQLNDTLEKMGDSLPAEVKEQIRQLANRNSSSSSSGQNTASEVPAPPASSNPSEPPV